MTSKTNQYGVPRSWGKKQKRWKRDDKGLV